MIGDVILLVAMVAALSVGAWLAADPDLWR